MGSRCVFKPILCAQESSGLPVLQYPRPSARFSSDSVMNTSQDQKHVHYSDIANKTDSNHINNSQESQESLFSSHADKSAQQNGGLDYSQMDTDQVQNNGDLAYNSSINARKDLSSDAGQKFHAPNDFSDNNTANAFLDSLIGPRTSEYANSLGFPSPTQLSNQYLSSAYNKLSDQDFYGFQPLSQPSPGYGQSSIFADPAPSSSYDTSSSTGCAASSKENGATLRVDFSAFNDGLRQYQQAAMASQNTDTSNASYFQQPASSRQGVHPSFKHSLSIPLHKQNRPRPFQQHSSSPLPLTSGIGEADRQWLNNRIEQATRGTNMSLGNQNPSDSHFARYHVTFSKALWDASDVSREPGIISEQRQVGLVLPPVDIPAKDQYLLYHSSSLSPEFKHSDESPPLSLPPPNPSGFSAQQTHSASSYTHQSFNGQSEVDRRQAAASTSSQEAEASANQFSGPSTSGQQRHSYPNPLAYRTQSFSSLSNQTETEGSGSGGDGSAGHAASDWSTASRYPPRATIAPIKIPGPYRTGSDQDHAHASLSSAGSSTRFDTPSPSDDVSPQSPKRKDSIPSYTYTSSASAVQSETGKRLYECKVCSRKFPRPSALVVHERIHSGDKPFVCEVCDRPFTVASNLRRHQKIHANQRKQINTDARAAESTGPSTVRARPQRSKPYPSSSGQQTDKDSRESDLSGEMDDGHTYGSSDGSTSPMDSLRPTGVSSAVMEWNQKVCNNFAPP